MVNVLNMTAGRRQTGSFFCLVVSTYRPHRRGGLSHEPAVVRFWVRHDHEIKVPLPC